MAKNLIFCFDGTTNDPNDAKPEKKWFGLLGSKDRSISNIIKLHLYFGGDLLNSPTSNEQHSFYYSGIGTYGGWLRQKINSAISPEKMDVRVILNKAGADLKNHYQAGDRVYMFGFSRGAALARRFACLVRKYVPTIDESDLVIRFLGVFDTVASIGLPNLKDERKPRTRVVFENMTVSRHVQEALHILSIDENRIAFQPTLMNKGNHVTEIWFPGGHSDVGGGFAEHGLSDIALRFILDQIRKSHTDLVIQEPEEVDLSKIIVAKGQYTYTLGDIVIQPNHLDKLHVKKRFWPVSKMTLDHRDIRVNVDDRISEHKPTVHHSMVDRAKADGQYRPEAMMQVGHYLLAEDDHLTEYTGLGDHLLP